MVERGRSSVKFGFGFYLSLSLFLHLFLFVLFSNVTFPEIRAEREEIVPVAIQMREPLAREAPRYLPDWLDAGEFIPPQLEDRVAGLSRLPASFRWAPRPPTPDKISAADRVRGPELEREEFSPPEPERPRPEMKTVEEPEETVIEPREPEVAPVEEADEIDEFLSPGESPTRQERQLLRQPSFPHARLRELLPEEGVRVPMQLTVAADGEVVALEIERSTGVEELDQKLAEWVESWVYDRADREDTVEINIEIPAE